MLSRYIRSCGGCKLQIGLNLPPKDNLWKEDKSSAPKVSFIRRFHCIQENLQDSAILDELGEIRSPWSISTENFTYYISWNDVSPLVSLTCKWLIHVGLCSKEVDTGKKCMCILIIYTKCRTFTYILLHEREAISYIQIIVHLNQIWRRIYPLVPANLVLATQPAGLGRSAFHFSPNSVRSPRHC